MAWYTYCLETFEMMEVIGLAASVGSLLDIVIRVTGKTYTYVQSAKHASAEVKELHSTVKHLTGALGVLQNHIKSIDPSEASALHGLDEPVSECAVLLESFLEKLQAPKEKRLDKLIHSLVWPLKEKETTAYVSRLKWFMNLFELALTCDQLLVFFEFY